MAEYGKRLHFAVEGLSGFNRFFGTQPSQANLLESYSSSPFAQIPGAINCAGAARPQRRPESIAVVHQHLVLRLCSLLLACQGLSAGKTMGVLLLVGRAAEGAEN